LNPASLADIWDDFRRVGEAVGVNAEPLIRELQGRMMPARTSDPPTVACVEWIEPLMAAGNWTPELIDLAGGVDVFGKPGIHSPWITWDELRARDPDVIIVAPCSFDLARTRGEMHWLTERPEFSCLKAVQTGRLFLADGNQFFNRPGPRIVETLRIIRQMIGTVPGGTCCDPEKWALYSKHP
jgi:iron complex transport system substrate-binding protein